MIYKKAIEYCNQCYKLAQNATVHDCVQPDSKLNTARTNALKATYEIADKLNDEEFQDKLFVKCCICAKQSCKIPKIAEFLKKYL